ncbi:MAG TPA: SDR family oxidoreductase [Acidimicrobiales bacterium]|jgi:NAD(P)-dependent dehydrogenase (short-subunit alcohol dehydrogenase family)|nr:SDR family oxidoreductase [Acidimicrobiales bacterium]
MNKKVVLITGASSGIGLVCAQHLSDKGHTVIGASRRTATGHAWTSIAMDVDDDQSVTAGVERVISEFGGMDAVVTCAGWGLAGSVEQTPIGEARAQMETNFFGTVRTVVAALPSLRERGGKVVLMSSIGGIIGIPFQAYYSASKFALEGWAEALAWEVKPHGVSVTLIEPGNFHTGFTESRRTVAVSGDDPYASARTKAIEIMERDELGGADPAAVAKLLSKVLASGRPPRRRTVGPVGERIGPMAKRILPTTVFEAASASSLGV